MAIFKSTQPAERSNSVKSGTGDSAESGGSAPSGESFSDDSD